MRRRRWRFGHAFGIARGTGPAGWPITTYAAKVHSQQQSARSLPFVPDCRWSTAGPCPVRGSLPARDLHSPGDRMIRLSTADANFPAAFAGLLGQSRETTERVDQAVAAI